MSDFTTFPIKDPTAKLDYLFDWAPKTNNRELTDWLKEDELITSQVVSVDPIGLTIVSDSIVESAKAVLVWLSGGTDLVTYTVSCKIVTNKGREDTRRAIIPVKNR